MKHPPTLTVDADALINECELAEMSPNSQDELLPAIHMAALLYQCQLGHARHLWRRTLVESDVFQDWCAVARAMIRNQGVSDALILCESRHPAPLNQYATEVKHVWESGQRKPTPSTPPQLTEHVVSFLESVDLLKA